MACDYCKYDRGHHPQCPEADERKEICWCIECKEGIYEGDVYYKIGNKPYCKYCVDMSKDVAEYYDLYSDCDWNDEN